MISVTQSKASNYKWAMIPSVSTITEFSKPKPDALQTAVGDKGLVTDKRVYLNDRSIDIERLVGIVRQIYLRPAKHVTRRV